MESQELMTVSRPQELFVSPVVGMDEAKAKFEQVRKFTATCLTKGVDYGTFAGVAKPSLLKPGAEKVATLFGLNPRFTLLDSVKNWNGEGNPDNEPFFYFEYKCELYRGGEYVGSCDASCNSWEKKYRYRLGELVCPNCGKPLRKSKNNDGYYCWAKQGGCGTTFASNDTRITSQKVGVVKNFDTAEQVNTFQKMAQKRAFIGATLIACNLSEYYTQDIEDMDRASFIPEDYTPETIEGDFAPVQAKPQVQQSQQKPKFDEIEFLKQWSKPANVGSMHRNNAESMVDDKGQPYGEKDTYTLWCMQQTIQKKLDDNGITDEQRSLYGLKLSAVCEILHCRKMEKTLSAQNSAMTYEGA